jgi:NAD(P)H-hydrate repair Nnr-like enzyme with NAD(P)H-hydrate epimerase domain
VTAPRLDLEPTLRAHADVDLVIGALPGYSLAGDLREPVATIIPVGQRAARAGAEPRHAQRLGCD